MFDAGMFVQVVLPFVELNLFIDRAGTIDGRLFNWSGNTVLLLYLVLPIVERSLIIDRTGNIDGRLSKWLRLLLLLALESGTLAGTDDDHNNDDDDYDYTDDSCQHHDQPIVWQYGSGFCDGSCV